MATRRTFLGSAAATLVTGVPTSRAQTSTGRPFGADDPLGVRADFPVVERSLYLNSAYITPSPLPVIRAGRAFLEAKAHDPVSLGEMLQTTDGMRERFARLVGARTREIGVLYATSDGENIVTRALDLAPGDNVVIDDLHYETTYALYRRLEAERGIELRIVANAGGAAPVEAFARQVDARTRVVSVSWVSHQNGYRHDLRGLAELAHAHGAYLYADAIQGIGMLEIDVGDTGIDFLTAGTYKWLLGGYGVAPFYVADRLLERIDIDRSGSLNIAAELPGHRYEIHDDARKYGYATMSFGAVYQLSAALDYLHLVGVDRIEAHTVGLAGRLHRALAERGFSMRTPADNRSAIVAFEHGAGPDRVARDLAASNTDVSQRVDGTQLRVGVALFNTEAEIDRFVDLAERWLDD